MGKRWLYFLSGLLWSFASYKILGKGLPALMSCHSWWVIILCILICAGFGRMFRMVSTKYIKRIMDLPGEKFAPWQFMSIKGYLIIGFMMTTGIVCGRIPGMPDEFFASLYPGLGSGLLYGALRFYVAMFKSC